MVSITTKDPRQYVEAKDENGNVIVQKEKGWYWHYPTKKFYRWSNIPKDGQV